MDMASWLQINNDFYENLNFTIENKTVFAKNKFLHKTALFLNENFESILRNNPNIKKRIRDIYYRFNQSKEEEVFEEKIVCELQKIYEKSNSQLKEFFIKEGLNRPSWL
jgi:hypothetical protein